MDRAKVQVTMTNWAVPLTPRPTVGFTGEHDVTEFEVLTTPESGVTYYLEVKAWRKEPNNILFDKESDRLTVRLTSEMLGAAGIKKAQVVAYLTDGDDTPIKKSNIFEIEVKNSINATKDVEPHYQTALEQWNKKLDEMSGLEYTAGDGIDIEDDVISVDNKIPKVWTGTSDDMTINIGSTYTGIKVGDFYRNTSNGKIYDVIYVGSTTFITQLIDKSIESTSNPPTSWSSGERQLPVGTRWLNTSTGKYFVCRTNSDNHYDWVSFDVDLTNYYTKAEVNTLVSDKAKVWRISSVPLNNTITIGTDYEGVQVDDFVLTVSSFSYILYIVVSVGSTTFTVRRVDKVVTSTTTPPTTWSTPEYTLGTIWVNSSTNQIWMLKEVTNSGYEWELLTYNAGSGIDITNGEIKVKLDSHPAYDNLLQLGDGTQWSNGGIYLVAPDIAYDDNVRQMLTKTGTTQNPRPYALASKEYVDNNAIIVEAKGENISLVDSASRPLKAISVMGKSSQNGTPTIDTPIPITNVADSGSLDININGTTHEVTTTALRGIPVSSDGNYTDENNQQWICDSIERYANGSGKYIQRVNTIVFDGSENWQDSSNSRVYVRNTTLPNSNANAPMTLFSHFSLTTSQAIVGTNDNTYIVATGNLVASPTQNGTRLNAEQFKTYLASNNATLLYTLDTPIETPLTAEQLAELDLSTYKPTTTISSEAGLVIEYVADTKNYIDNLLLNN